MAIERQFVLVNASCAKHKTTAENRDGQKQAKSLRRLPRVVNALTLTL